MVRKPARTIQSPGVEIKEIDLSLNAGLPVGTNILLNGFAPQGPTQELVNVTSMTELEQIYGAPTNAAERYFYHTAAQIIDSPANLLVNRLPYGSEDGDGFSNTYTALLYPIYAIDSLYESVPGTCSNIYNTLTGTTGINYTDADRYYVGAPTQITLTEEQYTQWKSGNIDWEASASTFTNYATSLDTAGKAGMIIINKAKTTINDVYEGYYVGISDNIKSRMSTNGLPDFTFDSIKNLKVPRNTGTYTSTDGTTGLYTTPVAYSNTPSTRLDFSLTGNLVELPNSISQAIESIPEWNFGVDSYNDALILGLYKIRIAEYGVRENMLTYVPVEQYTGSLGESRTWTGPFNFGKTSYFLENIVKNDSFFLDVMINTHLSQDTGNWIGDDGNPVKSVRVLASQQRTDLAETLAGEITGITYSYGYDISGSVVYLNSLGTAVSTITADPTTPSSYISSWSIPANCEASIYSIGGVSISTYADDIVGFTTVSGSGAISGSLNPFTTSIIASAYNTYTSLNGDNAYGVGPYVACSLEANKVIGDIPAKLDLGLRLAENYEQVPIDIVVDGGLSNIWATVKSLYPDTYNDKKFDDTIYVTNVLTDDSGTGYYLGDQTNGASSDIQNHWATVFNKFNTFCQEKRKDCIIIMDMLRSIFIQGKNALTLDDKSKNYSQHIYWPIKNLLSETNSNYACAYANWVKNYDSNLGDFFWQPFSGFMAAIMARVDSNLQPWFAPAGLNNGIVRGALDLALNTTQPQRDLLYNVNANPVVFFPGDGFTVWGQKTLQKKPSAFDRINVRRLFLVLEKATRAIMRYFVFEPNTVFTRTRVVNILTPIFEIAKNNEGVYDYLIVCDERNNTADVIDRNELVVDIYIKPVRAAEFILVNFIATRTDQDFAELI